MFMKQVKEASRNGDRMVKETPSSTSCAFGPAWPSLLPVASAALASAPSGTWPQPAAVSVRLRVVGGGLEPGCGSPVSKPPQKRDVLFKMHLSISSLFQNTWHFSKPFFRFEAQVQWQLQSLVHWRCCLSNIWAVYYCNMSIYQLLCESC